MQISSSTRNALNTLLEGAGIKALQPAGESAFFTERRREPRYAATGTARVSFPNGKGMEPTMARVMDISKSGMRLGVLAEIKPGTMVEIEFETLKAVGIVRHCRKYGPEYSIGIRLDGVLVKDGPAEGRKIQVGA